MPTVTVKLSAAPAPTPPTATIVSDRGARVALPFAPVEITLGGHTPQWQTLARTGRAPLNVRSGGPLPTWHGQITLAHLDWHESVQPLVDALLEIAAAGDAVTFSYGGPERGRWRITDCSVDVQLRTPAGDTSRAVVDLSLTAAADVAAHAGPTSGGAKKPKAGSAPTTAPASSRPHPGAPATYVVRQGDTLSAIAGRVYGDPNDWHRIADANHIRDPRTLAVGQKLQIP